MRTTLAADRSSTSSASFSDDSAAREATVTAPLAKALEKAFAQKQLRWSAPPANFNPFYGDHFDPMRVSLGGQAYRVLVSHEEGIFGPPTTAEEARVAILQRLSDGFVSSDLPFVVPLAERTPRPSGPVQYLPPQWW